MAVPDPAARRLIDEALGVLAAALAGYIAERLREGMGPDWEISVGVVSTAMREHTEATLTARQAMAVL